MQRSTSSSLLPLRTCLFARSTFFSASMDIFLYFSCTSAGAPSATLSFFAAEPEPEASAGPGRFTGVLPPTIRIHASRSSARCASDSDSKPATRSTGGKLSPSAFFVGR